MVEVNKLFTLLNKSVLAVGILMGTIVPIYYAYHGYQPALAIMWVTALVAITIVVAPRDPKRPRGYCPGLLNDIGIMSALLIAFAILYFTDIYTIPWQVNTDEVTIMLFAQRLTEQNHPDIFGLSDYFKFPAFIFIAIGWLGKMLGGIDLLHMRIVHALFGVTIIAATYLLFRIMFNPLAAVVGTVLLGSNHALIAISRMAMRDNTALLTEVVSLGLLLYGLQKQSRLATVLGGIVAGLAFYTYFPGRVTIVLWTLFLLGLIVWRQTGVPVKRVLTHSGMVMIGFILTVAPIVVATMKTEDTGSIYIREQLLFFPEGRRLQMQFAAAPTIADGVRKNIVNGLTVFNNTVHDHGYIYANYGHGFVEPLTGILVWIGVVITLLKRSRTISDRLFMGCFAFLWVVTSFVINKSPQYTRLLNILPFVAYFALVALMSGAAQGAKLLQRLPGVNVRPTLGYSLVLLGGVLISVVGNLRILGDFVHRGLAEGNDVGGTARYVEERRYRIPYSFYLAANTTHPYYDWGQEWQWKDWLGFFTNPSQQVAIIDPNNPLDALGEPPLTLFLNRERWQQFQKDLWHRFPTATAHHLTPDGQLIAFEATEQP